MSKLIIIKYGELTTKKGNLHFFLKTLKRNIVHQIKPLEAEIEYDGGRMYIKSPHLLAISSKLAFVFGIQAYIIGYRFPEKDWDSITKPILEILKTKKFQTFKVVAHRAVKKFPLKSTVINQKLGALILQTFPHVQVKLANPDLIIYLEFRFPHLLVYFNEDFYPGLGGYPVGTQGKGLLLLSGGIDSPVAGYLALKRGLQLEAVYFESLPHTSFQARQKVITLTQQLARYNHNEIKLQIVNFTPIQTIILKQVPASYRIIIMRRMMYRIAAQIAQSNQILGLITGESLGQVASQTLTSLHVINSVISTLVLRPLIGADKTEIMALARQIGTYETSILPYEDCCTIFVPNHPIINPQLELCESYEQLIKVEDLLTSIQIEKLIIKPDESSFNDLL